MKRKRLAGPFDALLGVTPPLAANTGSAVLVVEGLRVANQKAARAVAAAVSAGPWAAQQEAKRLAAELRRVAQAKYYQLVKLNPEAMAKRKAWDEANKEKRREAIRRWRAENAQKNRDYQKAWNKRRYHDDPDVARAKARAWYAANRDAILQRLQDKRDRLKAQASEQHTQPAPGKQT